MEQLIACLASLANYDYSCRSESAFWHAECTDHARGDLVYFPKETYILMVIKFPCFYLQGRITDRGTNWKIFSEQEVMVMDYPYNTLIQQLLLQ